MKKKRKMMWIESQINQEDEDFPQGMCLLKSKNDKYFVGYRSQWNGEGCWREPEHETVIDYDIYITHYMEIQPPCE